LEIIPSRMVALGYGKFWRSDEIVGLCRIEEDRGAGRRTEVHVATSEEPIVASRSERSILRDMVRLPDEEFRAEEARDLLAELLDDLSDINPVLRRMLANEVRVDIRAWEQRIAAILEHDGDGGDDEQEDLFSSP
jgi:hypothetical protein